MENSVWLAPLLGGLGLFLYGLEVFSSRLRVHAGEGMRRLLMKMTATRWHGLLVGVGLTALIQSSSVVTALTVGLVEAGMINFSQALAVVMGTNIGTTITMQLMAFKITDMALWLVFLGAFSLLFWRWQQRYIAELVLALGLIFLGLNLMADAMRPLQDALWMQSLLAWMDTPWSAALVGLLVTAVIQSSSAFGGIALALVMQGQIDLVTGVALMLGSNVGTCITVMLAAIGKSRESIRVAVFHLLFNLVGALTMLLLLSPFIQLIFWVSGDVTPAQYLANGHALFNIVVAFALIGFVPQLVRLIHWLVPADAQAWQPTEPLAIEQPNSAAEGINEGWRLLRSMLAVMDSLRDVATQLPQSLSRGETLALRLAELRQLDQRLLILMSLTGKLMMDDRQERELLQLTRLGNRLRSLGVLLAQSIPDVYANMQRESLAMSQETQALYRTLQHRIDEQLTGLFSMIEQRDGIHIPTLRDEKKEMRQLRASLEAHHGKRLSADQPNRVALYVYESMLLDTWMQVAYLSRRTAGLLKKTAEPSTQESLF